MSRHVATLMTTTGEGPILNTVTMAMETYLSMLTALSPHMYHIHHCHGNTQPGILLLWERKHLPLYNFCCYGNTQISVPHVAMETTTFYTL